MNLRFCIDDDDVQWLGSLVFIHEISPQFCWHLIFIRFNHFLQPHSADVGGSQRS